MKRKINRVGTSTLTVSLPSKWAKKYDLIAGDEVDVEEEGSNLVVSTRRWEKVEKAKAKLISKNQWYVSQVIRNLYTAGYDEIEVSFDDPDAIVAVQHIVDLLLGFEIVEQNDKGCLIKNLSSGLEEEFSVLLRKVFLLSLSMFDLMIEDLSKNKIENFKKQQDININAHRFAVFCRRMLRKKHMFTERTNVALYVILQRVNMVTHNITYIYKYLDKQEKFSLKKETVGFIKNIKKMFEDFYKAFYSKDIEVVARNNKERWHLINDDLPKILALGKEHCMVGHFLGEIIRLTASSGGALFTFITTTKDLKKF